jgi:hypothetical protein
MKNAQIWADFLLGLHSCPKDGDNTFLRNVCYSQRTTRSYIPEDWTQRMLREPQMQNDNVCFCWVEFILTAEGQSTGSTWYRALLWIVRYIYVYIYIYIYIYIFSLRPVSAEQLVQMRSEVKWSEVKWSEKCFLSYSEINSKLSWQMRTEVQWSELAVKHSLCHWISNKPRKTSDFQSTIGYRYMSVCMRVCSHMPLFLP